MLANLAQQVNPGPREFAARAPDRLEHHPLTANHFDVGRQQPLDIEPGCDGKPVRRPMPTPEATASICARQRALPEGKALGERLVEIAKIVEVGTKFIAG